jgi:transcriptional regulator with XRE-family HTH domain
MSQDELAEKSGVNQATIAMLERGHRQPRRGTVEKLAAALGVAVETLEG